MKKITILLTYVLLIHSSAFTQSSSFENGIDPKAGTWKTWVISSGGSFTIPPPPNAKVTATEMTQMKSGQTKIDSSALAQIHHWDAGPPSYQWGRITDNLIDTTQSYLRVYALVNVAIYDATIAAWHNKYLYNRPRPTKSNGLKQFAAAAQSPSYPCEHSVTAGAAATILAYLYPAKAVSIMQLAKQVGQSRIMAGVQYPSDVEAGFKLGVQVAEYIIEHRAKGDGFEKKWPGKIPDASGYWKGKPLKIDIPNCKPWVLLSTNQFRSTPPPDVAKDIAELKSFKRTPGSNHRALKWEYEWPWGPLTDRMLMEYNWWKNPPRAARVYALLAIADHENQIANIESKYIYFRIRPTQYDTTFTTVFKTPPSPSYPAGHATVASCLATVLTYLFPYDAKEFYELAEEEALSRFEGGVHYRTDNEAGLEMGRKVGEEIVKRAKKDGSE